MPIDECSWSTTNKDAGFDIAVNGTVVKYSAPDIGFTVLGTKTTFNDNYDSELKNRISRAWGAYCKHNDLLKRFNTSLRKIIDFLLKVVAGGLFWCAGSWKLTVQQESKLRSTQRRMIRGLLNLRKTDAEDMATFQKR